VKPRKNRETLLEKGEALVADLRTQLEKAALDYAALHDKSEASGTDGALRRALFEAEIKLLNVALSLGAASRVSAKFKVLSKKG